VPVRRLGLRELDLAGWEELDATKDICVLSLQPARAQGGEFAWSALL